LHCKGFPLVWLDRLDALRARLLTDLLTEAGRWLLRVRRGLVDRDAASAAVVLMPTGLICF